MGFVEYKVALGQVILQTSGLSRVCVMSPLIPDQIRLERDPQQKVKRLKPGDLRTKTVLFRKTGSIRSEQYFHFFPNFPPTEDNAVWQNCFLMIELLQFRFTYCVVEIPHSTFR